MNMTFCFMATTLLFACNRKTPAATSSADTNTIQTKVIADSAIPSCVQHRIDSIKQLRVWNPPAEVHEYWYDGMKVYLFSADCCDQFPSLLDENCNSICAPSGGFTGKGDGRCPEFNKEAKHIRLVWKDNRKRK